MRRRDVLAGLGSVGVVAGAGVMAVRGPPSLDGNTGTGESQPGDSDETDSTNTEPLTIETIDAPGSEADAFRVPAADRATFLDFFGTWCPPCVEQMPALAEANERIGDEVLFMSVTSESIPNEELADWWEKHDGSWLLGLDPTAELTARYLAGGYPSAVAIDASGTVQWSDSGIKTADELVAGIEQALAAGGQ